MQPELGNSSHVKFGGYDINAIKDANIDNLKMYKTNNNDCWEIKASLFRFGSDVIFPDDPGAIVAVDINPEYHYIYMPNSAFLKMSAKLS